MDGYIMVHGRAGPTVLPALIILHNLLKAKQIIEGMWWPQQASESYLIPYTCHCLPTCTCSACLPMPLFPHTFFLSKHLIPIQPSQAPTKTFTTANLNTHNQSRQQLLDFRVRDDKLIMLIGSQSTPHTYIYVHLQLSVLVDYFVM